MGLLTFSVTPSKRQNTLVKAVFPAPMPPQRATTLRIPQKARIWMAMAGSSASFVQEKRTAHDIAGAGSAGSSGSGMNSASSASGSFILPAFQSAAAWVRRTLEEDTKFQ